MRALLLFLFAVLLLLLALERDWLVVPPEHDPRVALDHRHPPNWLTGWKLRRTVADPVRCADFLASTPLRIQPVPDVVREDGCGYTDAVRVSGSTVNYGQRFVMSCPLAASLVMFEHHTLQPAAREVFGEEVARVDHYGTYACRNTYGRESGRLSQHARANAFDVSGFQLSGGRRISLVNHWNGDEEERAFLRLVRDGACRWFTAVLGPEYNAAHADHFHFDRGPYRICR